MATETLTRGHLPRIQWSPVITGVLCALAAHIVLGLFGAAFGFAADPADSKGVGVAAGLWGILVPFVASAIGAFVCVRIAREAEPAGAYLHGALVWCIGLIAGALFLTGTMATGAMSSATAASGNARGALSRLTTPDATRTPRAEARMEDAEKGAAAAAGAGGLAALLGLAGAFLGAAAGRGALTGRALGMQRGHGKGPGLLDRMHLRGEHGHAHRADDYERGWRDAMASREDRSGVVTSTTRTEPRSEGLRPDDDPAMHH